MKPIPKLGYAQAREKFKPGDLIFFPAMGLNHVRSLSALGGWLSNQLISKAQFVGADHRRYNHYIHVETLVPFTMDQKLRWWTAGFTNKKNQRGGGLDINFASWRLPNYPEAPLFLPVKEECRGALRASILMHFIEKDSETEYGTLNLLNAESRLHVGEFKPNPFCSSWVTQIYLTCGVIDKSEFRSQRGRIKKALLPPTNVSPKDMLQTFCCFDWHRACHIEGE